MTTDTVSPPPPATSAAGRSYGDRAAAKVAAADEMFMLYEVDLHSVLPLGWQSQLMAVAEAAEVADLKPTSITSREAPDVASVRVRTVDGIAVAHRLPWLVELYRGILRDLVQVTCSEPVSCATDPRIAINLNVQRGNRDRYEAHVDSNPRQGLLYVTTHPDGEGGELVVSHDQDRVGTENILRSAMLFRPVAGRFVIFDARRHPHFVAPLRDEHGIRVAVAMNFYVPSCPESARPRDLTPHLFPESEPAT